MNKHLKVYYFESAHEQTEFRFTKTIFGEKVMLMSLSD